MLETRASRCVDCRAGHSASTIDHLPSRKRCSMADIRIRQMVHANICVRDMEKTVPFYERLGFEKLADQVFEAGAGVWRGLGLEDNRRFRAVFMKIPGDSPVPFLDIIRCLDRPTAGDVYEALDNVGIARLCVEVADVDAVAAQGVEFVGPVSP
ncbi:MAG: VOC family protein [Gammaproteobacteria bacterium]|nr:VOC family protein [Gammaproteobacteria bacterium]